ncbi:hypothetical protein ATANTOWER_025641 [Ataeniobius toweri]|uniref:Uncharacterized protein n=1 Tax=Ataeniobius toweri TaxID=208326 RepID=A0ABU7AB98_9TELE|nr:hypothetical protein [Ataeniobius toweri]
MPKYEKLQRYKHFCNALYLMHNSPMILLLFTAADTETISIYLPSMTTTNPHPTLPSCFQTVMYLSLWLTPTYHSHLSHTHNLSTLGCTQECERNDTIQQKQKGIWGGSGWPGLLSA